MTDERKRETGWTPAERQALRQLIRMGLDLAAGDCDRWYDRRAFEFGAGWRVARWVIRGWLGYAV